jgi:hypothetical protein
VGACVGLLREQPGWAYLMSCADTRSASNSSITIQLHSISNVSLEVQEAVRTPRPNLQFCRWDTIIRPACHTGVSVWYAGDDIVWYSSAGGSMTACMHPPSTCMDTRTHPAAIGHLSSVAGAASLCNRLPCVRRERVAFVPCSALWYDPLLLQPR